MTARPDVSALLDASPGLRDRYRNDAVLRIHMDMGLTITEIIVAQSVALGSMTKAMIDAEMNSALPRVILLNKCPKCGCQL